MAKKAKKQELPDYKTFTTKTGAVYYRHRIQDADGKQLAVYGKTPEELHEKILEAEREVEDIKFRRLNPTVKEYCERWLRIKSGTIQANTLAGYKRLLDTYVVAQIGEEYMDEVTTDDLRLLMVPVSKRSAYTYSTMNMLVKCLFSSAEDSRLIEQNPATPLKAKGGKPSEKKEALTDEQVKILVNTVRDLPPYVFVMLGLYAGLRREESLALQWDCVHLDAKTPFLSVKRAWHGETTPPTITTTLKTPASRRDIPIPQCLVTCLREAKERSASKFVISNREGGPLNDAQFTKLWNYIRVRSTDKRVSTRYVNGTVIKHEIIPTLGDHAYRDPKIVCTMDFHVTTHQLRHTYITNLIYHGVDPKTVQYLAGHKNSKMTMDVYAKVKYNKPGELLGVVNAAFAVNKRDSLQN